MKSQKEIEERLTENRKQRKACAKRFQKYDNSEDMHQLDEYDAEIEILEWILMDGDL